MYVCVTVPRGDALTACMTVLAASVYVDNRIGCISRLSSYVCMCDSTQGRCFDGCMTVLAASVDVDNRIGCISRLWRYVCVCMCDSTQG